MKKTMIRVIAGFMAILMLAGVVSSVFAEGSWTDQVYGYGSGLSEDQIKETGKLLGIKDESTPKIKISGVDTEKYLGFRSKDSSMISSVYIKNNKTKSVRVEVTTPFTIQKVSSLQYSNAAITAGLEDVDIYVAAVRPVTGESALAGVYKALEEKGVAIDTNKTKSANEEIQVINVIADENKDKEGFSKEKLNESVVQVKKDLVDKKEEVKQDVTADQVRDVIQNVIKDNNLQQYVNNVQIDNLTVVMQNFINSDNIDLEKVRGQLDGLAKQAREFADTEMSKMQEYLKSPEGQKYLESIKGSISQENIEKYLNGAKDALNSKEVESLLNGVKENLTADKLNDLLSSAKDSIGIDGEKASQAAGGFFEAIGQFFSSIFEAIGNLFK